MALIIGSLALLVGLVALWLATISMKKIGAVGDTLMQRVRSDQRRITEELTAKITALERQNRNFTEQLKSLGKKEEN